jgi:hypothetical protein
MHGRDLRADRQHIDLLFDIFMVDFLFFFGSVIFAVVVI